MVLPLFVCGGRGQRRPIAALPGHFQLSVDELAAAACQAAELGLGGVLLFGIPDRKDPQGSESLRDDGLVQHAVRAAKQAAPDLLVMTDVCLCQYTDHGHCGLVRGHGPQAQIDNDATLEVLARQAVSHARAGADLVAPSGMMDGMVRAIRGGLDAAGHSAVPILSYSAKYASSFYGPFREAVDSAPQFGDRRSYQMDPAADPGQAVREVQLDLAEGADLVMVKPALAYLDILRLLRDHFPGVPLAAYNVSGEYSMIQALERAGADILITYWARQAAEWLAS
jgi:porphobilinogen synthase